MRAPLLLIVALTGAAATAAPAAASFPGRNGIFVTSEMSPCDGDNAGIQYLRAYSAGGKRLGALTPPCERAGDPERLRDASGPEFSPDGTRVLFHQQPNGTLPSQFFTVAPDASGRTAVTPPLSNDFTHGSITSFAPDGRRFIGTAISYANEAGSGLHVYPGDGGESRLVKRGRSFTSPLWSPDGRLVAVAGTAGASPAGLALIDARTWRTVRRLARPGVASFDWSPDGRRLVFATHFWRDPRTGYASGGSLYVVRADGRGKPRRIERPRADAATNPVWSPDGRSIAWIQLDFSGGDVGFTVRPSIRRLSLRTRRTRTIATLPPPHVSEGEYPRPQLGWQPLPGR